MATDETRVGRRLLKNFGVLFGGRTAAAVMTLGATAITAASMAPSQFGMIVLLHSYLLVVRGVFNLKPFEAVIKYGVPAQDNADQGALHAILLFSIRCDVFSSIVATLAGILAVPIVSTWLGWEGAVDELAPFYCIGLVATGTGTAKGLLRLHDRFDLLAMQLAVGPMVRLAGCLAVWSSGGSIAAFVLVWAAAFWVENMALIALGWLEYRRGRSPGSGAHTDDRPPTFPGLRHFMAVVYWQSNLDLVPKQVSKLLVGAVIGTAGAGLFSLARDFSNILAKPALLVRQVAFPDLTRLWHRRDPAFVKVVARLVVYSGVVGMALVAISVPLAKPLLLQFFGPDYTPAAALVTLLLGAATLELMAAGLRTSAYAMGFAGSVLWIQIGATIVYVAGFVILGRSGGLVGIGAAACIAALLSLAGLLLVVVRNALSR